MVSMMQEVMDIIKGSQGKKTSEIHQGNLHLLGTKVSFLFFVILLRTMGTWQNIVGKITNINIMVLVNLRETIFQEEFMNSHS